MCGIGAVISKNTAQLESKFTSFMKVIDHRGPDHQAIEKYENVLIGNNRLSIIDDHTRANQPMSYDQFVLSWNGAIHNFLSIKKELEELNHQFITESDTEVILHAYQEWGEDCVNRFDGMWSIILFDQKKKEIWCSRDRYGCKPFYYFQKNDEIWLGSELKQFQSISPVTICEEVAMTYLSTGMINTDHRSFFTDIFQLLPGHHMQIDMNSFEESISKYYDVEKTDDQTEHHLVNLIRQSVEDRLIADFPASNTFSGGLDSSILAFHTLEQNKSLTTFSYIPEEQELSEEEYIAFFIKKYPHENHQIHLGFTYFQEHIDEIQHTQDGPIASISMAAQNLLYRLIRDKHFKVAFSGQGADELFAGYDRNLRLLGFSSFLSYPFSSFSFVKNNYSKWRKHTSKTSLADEIFEKSSYEGFKGKSIQEYMKFQIEKAGLRDLLHYEDRNSMAYGIESRLPYLSHPIVEFAYHLPDAIKMSKLRRKGILLDLYKKVLPKEILGRRNKMAFDTPEKQWLPKIQNQVSQDFSFLQDNFSQFFRYKDMKIPSNLFDDVLLSWRLYFFSRWVRQII